MAVADFFLTPTAELADIVLPAATWLEMDYIGDYWKRHGWLLPRRKVIQVGECRSDHDMLNDLAHRVGQGEHWWDDFEQGLDWILEPMRPHLPGLPEDGPPARRGEVREVPGDAASPRPRGSSSSSPPSWPSGATTLCPSSASRPRAR